MGIGWSREMRNQFQQDSEFFTLDKSQLKLSFTFDSLAAMYPRHSPDPTNRKILENYVDFAIYSRNDTNFQFITKSLNFDFIDHNLFSDQSLKVRQFST